METYCCETFKHTVIEDNIICINDRFNIFGVPSVIADGDDYYDDVTETLVISFCPFCGKSLSS